MRRQQMEDGRMELRDRMLRAAIIEVLRAGFDPSGEGTPLSLVDAGLVRDVTVHGGSVRIELVGAAISSPFTDALVSEVERRVQSLPEVARTDVAVMSGRPRGRDGPQPPIPPCGQRGAENDTD
jgi:metal-sulfur cluster biosynthetic enzyme